MFGLRPLLVVSVELIVSGLLGEKTRKRGLLLPTLKTFSFHMPFTGLHLPLCKMWF